MAMKTIRVSEDIHTKLSHLGLKSETYNDIIARLISAYEEEYLDDFTDEEAAYYNERIRQFENGDYGGTVEIDVEA
ncbi:MAG: hypothetical protein Q4Q22_06525, partial [Methanosphaera sp.]|nr:hypothetical protein [Methanosphaera sp.]